MSSGDRTPYEVLAVRCNMVERALLDIANRDHQTVRAACAALRGRTTMALFLGDMLYARCEKHGGQPFQREPNNDRTIQEVLDATAEQRRACPYLERSPWEGWCWPCRARETVSEAEMK